MPGGTSPGAPFLHRGIDTADHPLEFPGSAGGTTHFHLVLWLTNQELHQVLAVPANEFINRQSIFSRKAAEKAQQQKSDRSSIATIRPVFKRSRVRAILKG